MSIRIVRYWLYDRIQPNVMHSWETRRHENDWNIENDTEHAYVEIDSIHLLA